MSVSTTSVLGVDPQVVEDLHHVERVATLFRTPGVRPEFWEVFTLLRSNRDAFRVEAARLDAARRAGIIAFVEGPLLKEIRDIRKHCHPLACELRVFLEELPTPLDGMRLELGLVLTMASARGREAALRWVADPVQQASEALPRIRVMTRLVDDYRKAILEQRVGAPAPPALAKPEENPLRIHPQFLGDLRAARRFTELLSGGRQPVELWEAVSFILMDRKVAAASLRELQRLKREGRPGEFEGEAMHAKQRIAEVRGRVGRFVGDLRVFFNRTFGSWEGEIEDLALAFIAASAQGRHRARRWLDDPALCKDEVARFVDDLRAGEYNDALKAPERSGEAASYSA